LLAAATEDPDDCYFGLWEGWGFPESAHRWPSFGIPRGARPPARSYFLFDGSLSEAEIWAGGRARERRDLGPFGVLARRRARVRVAVWPHLVRRRGRRPALGRDRCVRAIDQTADQRPASRRGRG